MDKKIIKSIIARQQELVCNVEFINTKPLFVSANDLDLSSTKSRETGSLVSLCKHMDNISHPLIVTMDTEEIIDTDDLKIEVMPVWKWLIDL